MSSPQLPSVTASAFKTRVLRRVAEVYSEEFTKMLADSEFAKLDPKMQIYNSDDVSSWFARWITLMPPVDMSIRDLDDFNHVPLTTPSSLNTMENSWYSALGIPRLVLQDQNSYQTTDKGVVYRERL
jgi:hypothetical protein